MKAPRHQGTVPRPPLSRLFASFLRLGATAFGGPAMIPYIRRLAVEQKAWLDDNGFREGIALSQTLPGTTAMQVAGYVGLLARGLAGATASFVGFGLPAFILMVVLSALYVSAHNLPAVTSAFNGLQAVIVAIVANAALMFGRASLRDWRDGLIVVVAGGAFGLGVNPILVIALAAILGTLLYRDLPSAVITFAPEPRPYPVRSLVLLLLATGVWLALLYIWNSGFFTLTTLMMRVSLFAFGGGFSALPLLYSDIVQTGHLMDSATFLNGVALGQITPGPVVITATFVGYVLYGPVGALMATVGVFLPSFFVLVAVEPYFARLRGSRPFNQAVRAVSVSFVGLLLSVAAHFALAVPWDVPRALLAAAAFVALFFNVEVIWVVLAATVVSVFVL